MDLITDTEFFNKVRSISNTKETVFQKIKKIFKR